MVLPTEPVAMVEADGFDLYLPPSPPGPAPATILVHGGPLRAAPSVRPGQWPVFLGYAAALTARGVAAVMFDHVLLQSVDYAAARAQLDAVVAAARAHPAVDGDRMAIWFFSGGAPLAAPALRDPAGWLRAVAFSYPMLRPLGNVSGFDPTSELASAARLPILLTRVGRELPDLAAAQQDFVVAAEAQGTDLTIIDVPDGHHAFDITDDTDQSRQAIVAAVEFLHTRLSAGHA